VATMMVLFIGFLVILILRAAMVLRLESRPLLDLAHKLPRLH
jgi:hypothetical protein